MLVRLGVLSGEFHWHKHDEQDEFFFVLDGLLRIEMDGAETVELSPRQAFIVPAGMPHGRGAGPQCRADDREGRSHRDRRLTTAAPGDDLGCCARSSPATELPALSPITTCCREAYGLPMQLSLNPPRR